MASGVYPAQKKDGTPYWRASVTHKGKHISLGSFDDETVAEHAYREACVVLRGFADKAVNTGDPKTKDPKAKDPKTKGKTLGDSISVEESSLGISDYSDRKRALAFDKWVALVNFRDNGIWCRGPIYLRKGYFEYYLSATEDYRFGPDDLFYYTHHTIQKRGGHLFVADYGMQVSVLSRYGVRPYSVPGRDYYFRNGDETDLRPGNLVIVNRYMGVCFEPGNRARGEYVARINTRPGITVVVGHYDTEEEAAVAYNKAIDILTLAGSTRAYTPNYLEDVSPAKYRVLYAGVKIRESALLKSFGAANRK
ncbi:MAG: hypothetical protein J5739_03705 [Lachnospiraceae bacterium]|nr:hypothetical protein [Lachnospiraceae bacterium]